MWQDILYNGVAPEEALATAQETVAADLEQSKFVSGEDKHSYLRSLRSIASGGS